MNTIRPVILAAAVAAALAACSGRVEKASLPPVTPAVRAVRVAKPAARLETGLGRATGAIRAREDATLAAKATGQIKRIRVEVGDRVRAGAPLVEMDPTTFRIQLENARAMERLAQANVAEAEREVARSKVLFDQGSLPQAGWDKAQTGRELAAAQLDQARAAVRGAEQAVSDTVIAAPFAGMITARWRNAGDTVTLMPVTPILALTDVDHLEAKLAVPETIEAFVKPGGRVDGVTTPGGQRFKAVVRVKGGVVDPATRTLEVLADVIEVEGPALRPGTLVNIDFGSFGAGGELFLPASAILTEGERSYVLVVADGKAERRYVDSASVNPGTVAVKKGLDAQADVILDPGALAPGDPVTFLANRGLP
ncbi:MAG TPA: efflux RND transporter periplasmic adaptor subunit [Anaeromyxobacteraceae bacterium]|nr:efflux RND transporter periplasmic adaptor subunit [Anaeromyxobacteraceae bacterium]